MKLFIGIDNGLSGGIAVLNKAQSVMGTWPMPILLNGKKKEYDIKKLARLFKQFKVNGNKVFVMLEKAHVRPISGKRACFMNGYGYGLMQGILSSLEISFEIVDPKVWQKALFEGTVSDTKKASISFCKKKFPYANLKATDKCRVDHDGIADALCMALYCYRRNR